MPRREAALAVNARFSSKTRQWKISLRKGRRTATATGPDYGKTYQAAMNALGFMSKLGSVAETLGKAPA